MLEQSVEWLRGLLDAPYRIARRTDNGQGTLGALGTDLDRARGGISDISSWLDVHHPTLAEPFRTLAAAVDEDMRPRIALAWKAQLGTAASSDDRLVPSGYIRAAVDGWARVTTLRPPLTLLAGPLASRWVLRPLVR